jgi:hypothetical protein
MKKIKVSAYDTTGRKIATYPSLREAARIHKTNVANVWMSANFIRHQTAGLVFRYAE